MDRSTVLLPLPFANRVLTQCCHPRCRNSHYPPHKHNGLTTHLILKGEFTIAYPLEKDAGKKTYGVGDIVDVEAGRVHEVWIGSEQACCYVIGE